MSETKEYSACFPCSVGLYGECLNLQPIEGDPDHFLPCYGKTLAQAAEQTEKRGPGRPVVEDFDDEKKLMATGRKRAAMMYPIIEGQECEWAWLRYAGGGVETIIGCKGNLLHKGQNQSAVHHGPDKSVLNNAPNNVHRICTRCHATWHLLNNKYYGKRPEKGRPFVPVGYEQLEHDKNTKATEEEIDAFDTWWKQNYGGVPTHVDED